MNYVVNYTSKSYKLNIVESTMCHADDLGNVITGLQNRGYVIFAVFSTQEPF